MEKEWFRYFFDKLYYETYRPYEDEERNKKEAMFIARALELAPGSRLLDIGCGYARHAVYLARMGYRVTCVDISEYLLEKAQERAKEFGVNLEFLKVDMRHLDFSEEFDGAYIFFTTFGYFSDEENLKVLKRVSRALRPGGRLLIDIWNKFLIIHRFVCEGRTTRLQWWKSGGYLILEEQKFNLEDERLECLRIFIKDGVIVDKKFFSIRTYSYGELKKMINEVGMKVIKAYGNYEGDPFRINSRRLIVVAQKS